MKERPMRKLIVAGLAVLALTAAATPAEAQAACGGGVTFNRAGEGARFWQVRPMNGMNCASARYVVNKWLRRSFARSWGHRLPTRFWDGYVTWHCGWLSYYRWQCNEYDSGTSFRFKARGWW
jgi:hypothetical protein